MGGMHAASLPDQRICEPRCARAGHPVQSSGYARPAMGKDMGRVFREKHATAQTGAEPRFQMSTSNEGLVMDIKKATAVILRVTIAVIILAMGLLAPPAGAHHSYAMYDG